MPTVTSMRSRSIWNSTSPIGSIRPRAETMKSLPTPRPKPPLEKTNLHPRNRHRGRYDFAALAGALPVLSDYLIANRFDANELTIDFANPAAVKTLNAALLKYFYAVAEWDMPAGYLCPPIPGRADYIHHAADLLALDHEAEIPRGAAVRVLDVGVGANCIYPLIGHHEYGWYFVASDVDKTALAAAQRTVDADPRLAAAIRFRHQPETSKIFAGMVKADDRFDLVICNPPFHASARAAEAGSLRKWKNLGRAPGAKPALNFGGQAVELWCEGGELGFVTRMVRESVTIKSQVTWFSALVSSEEHLPAIYASLKAAGASAVRTIEMAQGQKKSRIVAWRF